MQLEMNFDNNENLVKKNINAGNFSCFIEVNSPLDIGSLETEQNKLIEWEGIISQKTSLPIAFSITDQYKTDKSPNVIEFSNVLSSSNRLKHTIYLSGKNSNQSSIDEYIKLTDISGFKNIIAVSGNSQISKNDTFYESVNILNDLNIKNNDFFCGGVVNPFKYNSYDLYPQYYKLMKKINLGAKFIVTQCGWDMKKAQEILWYLACRDLYPPIIARVLLLSPEYMKAILKREQLGIFFPTNFQSLLQNEMKYNYGQFESMQWRRIQIMIAGYKLLGYSGVQIAGINTSNQLKTLINKISVAINEFSSFQEWKSAYLEHIDNADMTPYPNNYYIFNSLLETNSMRGIPYISEPKIKNISLKEKIYYNLSEQMLKNANKQPSKKNLLIKKLLQNCKNITECKKCNLPLTHYICTKQCPMKLENGPCGGTMVNGYCEITKNECIHSQITRWATLHNNIDMLETQHIL